MTDNKTKTGGGHDDLHRLTSATNLAVMAAEMLDRQVIEMADEAARAGLKLPYPVANAMRSIRLGARQLMRELRIDGRADDEGLTEAFDDAVERAWALVLIIIDRFGRDEEALFRAWCYLKAFPSTGGIPMPRWTDRAFAPREKHGEKPEKTTSTTDAR